MDTGCKHDLTTRVAIPTNQLDLVSINQDPILLSTAKDSISSVKIVPQQTGVPGEVVEPYVLYLSPDVFSIGRRCVLGGYGFQRLPYSLKPTPTCPSGEVAELISRDWCPYLDDYELDGHFWQLL